ncbi:glycosyltransferase family 2 protein [Hamadaea tsunoensis]|uniref:glycosyltransferase family 2 protein n=1 Tax=Hamadaea tsunoensis TaxID=53368 RepID=UPI0003F4F75D|nr:glycosyltransferase family 2 protein [Hamadaea tsunoensis]
MSWPSVGVVVPTHNRPGLLRKAVEGILEQDYEGPLRVLVVYDRAEPDESLASDGEHPVKVITNARTPGLAGARNTGIEALDTDLVAFCDDDDVWVPNKLRTQVAALRHHPDAEMVTCAIEVQYADRRTIRLAGQDLVTVEDLARSRMAMLHSSGFLLRRRALAGPDGLGLVAEDAPGSQNEDWDLLLRAARRHPVLHVDEPLVRVLWGRTSHYAYEYATKISSLRWMMTRHPEISGCAPGAARVYGQLACWSAAAGNKSEAWKWTRASVRANWREPRAAIALAALTGAVKVERVLGALHKHGHGI